MKFKKIITAGCSFSEPDTYFVWPLLLEKLSKEKDSTVTFDHRGLGSQGQQLIQKKSIQAIYKALQEGYKPEEICVIVMWSGHERRSWYIDNKDAMAKINDHWKKQEAYFQLQFGDLENNTKNVSRVIAKNADYPYQETGGWYISSVGFNELEFFNEYFMFSDGIESVIMSLENMLLLQSFCKVHGIKLYEQFFMDYVWEMIEKYKDHKECKHFYDLLDKSNYVSKQSINGYLKSIQKDRHQYISFGDMHPNEQGHKVWMQDVLVPHLEKTGFFN